MMNKQMKTIISIIIVAVMLMIAIPSSYAAGESNFSVKLNAPNTVEHGETLEVIVELDELSGTGKGINSFLGELEYDKTKLSIKAISQEEDGKINYYIVSQNEWDTPVYGDTTGKVVTSKGSMVKAKEAIMKIGFIVNSDAELGETTISIKNAEAGNDENDFVGKDGTITIEIVAGTTAPPSGEGDDDDDGQTPPPAGDEDDDDDGQTPPPSGDGDDDDDGQTPPPAGDEDDDDDGQIPPPSGDGDDDDDGQTPPPSGDEDDDDDGQTPPPSGDGDDDEQTPPPSGDGDDDEQTPPPSGDGKDDEKNPPTNDKKEEDKDNSTADKNYDKAGNGSIISIATMIIAVVAIIMYRKNKKYQDIF